MRIIVPLLFLLLFVPHVAANYSSGSNVHKGDDDFTPTFSSKPSFACFLDVDGDGKVGLSEPVFILYNRGAAGACDGLRKDDIRLTGWESFGAGTTVVAEVDHDFGKPVTAVAGAKIRFFDFDGDGKYRKKDTMYLDIDGGAQTVNVGDVRITPFGNLPAGSRVGPGDADLNHGLALIGGTDRNLHDAGMVFEAGKGVYLNADASASDIAVEEGDIRLTSKVPNPFEAIVPASIPAKIEELFVTSPFEGSVLISIQAKNSAPSASDLLLVTKLDGVTVDTRGLGIVKAGASVGVSILLPSPQNGVYEIDLNGSPAKLIVNESGVSTLAVEESKESSGFGALLLVASLGAILLAARR